MNHVRRIQELRRSNAAAPHRVKRYAGPDPAEWQDDFGRAWTCSNPGSSADLSESRPAEPTRNEEPVDNVTIEIDAAAVDGQEVPEAHVEIILALLSKASSLMVELATITKPGSPVLAGMVAGLGMTVESIHNRLIELQDAVYPQ